VNFDMARDHVPTYFTRDTNFINAPALNFIEGKTTDYNQNNEVLSNEGELIIFPSQLNHGYNENNGDNRISLSMNFMPTIVTNGDYGWRCVNLNQHERGVAFDEKEGVAK
jgi:ectoine hydroxylase-related dioxygenase (phytanoyl-CoA dioxygenase family)